MEKRSWRAGVNAAERAWAQPTERERSADRVRDVDTDGLPLADLPSRNLPLPSEAAPIDARRAAAGSPHCPIDLGTSRKPWRKRASQAAMRKAARLCVARDKVVADERDRPHRVRMVRERAERRDGLRDGR